jgi:hypothetical protein
MVRGSGTDCAGGVVVTVKEFTTVAIEPDSPDWDCHKTELIFPDRLAKFLSLTSKMLFQRQLQIVGRYWLS